MIHYEVSTKSDGPMTDKKINSFFKERNNFGSAKRIISPNLQHGSVVKVIRTDADITSLHQCDGLITARKDVVLAMKNADCFSLFFIHEEKGIMGLAHCGWRGIEKSLPGRMIRTMASEISSSEDNSKAIREIKIIIGPGIRSCHFEVQNDVWVQFYNESHKTTSMKKHIDLPVFIKIDLAKAGVDAEQITDSGECSFCLENKYYSHRRDKSDPIEHQLAVIGFNG